MKIKNEIKYDLARLSIKPIVSAMQADENTRAVAVTLTENNAVWEVPAGTSVSVAYQKPDGKKGLYDTLPNGNPAVKVSGNVVEFTLAPQMLTVPGTVIASVVLSDVEQKIHTFPIIINVIQNPAADANESEDYYNSSIIGSLDDLITKDKSSLVAAINEIAASSSGGDTITLNPVIVGEGEDMRTGVQILVTKPDGSRESYVVYDGKDGSGSGASVQPDLAQNDSTQPDYVKNRTHWEEGPTDIEWDGNSEGLDSFEANGLLFCKVADVCPTTEEVIGGSFEMSTGETYEIISDMIVPGDGCFSLGGAVFVQSETFTLTGTTVTAPSTGCYCGVNPNYGYVSKLTYGSTTVHPIDEKFIPDTIARKANTLPMPPTASVGQYIVVAAVDENGKVTATEAVTLPRAEEVAF